MVTAAQPSSSHLWLLKNSIVSDDFNRVVLEPEADIADSDYINASYVDVRLSDTKDSIRNSKLLLIQSLVQPKAYIVTQGPTESTMPDFWRMVWQERASCIVMVTRTFDFIRVMCVQYWPAAKNREEVYGGVGVTVETEEQLANFMIRYETSWAPIVAQGFTVSFCPFGRNLLINLQLSPCSLTDFCLSFIINCLIPGQSV